eukprot:4289259-Alexandrium_andersonii.AAC.1
MKVLCARLVVVGGVAWASVASLMRCMRRWWWELGSVENGIGVRGAAFEDVFRCGGVVGEL